MATSFFFGGGSSELADLTLIPHTGVPKWIVVGAYPIADIRKLSADDPATSTFYRNLVSFVLVTTEITTVKIAFRVAGGLRFA